MWGQLKRLGCGLLWITLFGEYKLKGKATASPLGQKGYISTSHVSNYATCLFPVVMRFDDGETRQGRRERDKLSLIRDVWDKWVQRSVDECLVAFRRRCLTIQDERRDDNLDKVSDRYS